MWISISFWYWSSQYCSGTGMEVSWQLSSNLPLNSTMSAWSKSLEWNKIKGCVVTHEFTVFHILVIWENKVTCQKIRTFGKSSLIFIFTFRNRSYVQNLDTFCSPLWYALERSYKIKSECSKFISVKINTFFLKTALRKY